MIIHWFRVGLVVVVVVVVVQVMGYMSKHYSIKKDEEARS